MRLRILGVLVAASCAGCAESEKPTALPVNDDFSDCSTGWSTDTDEFGSLSCTAGSYRVMIKNPQLPQNARIFFSEGVKSLSIAADATRRTGPSQTAGPREFLAYGVGCWKSPTQGYVFILSPDGAWGIERVAGTRPPAAIAGSETANAIPRLSIRFDNLVARTATAAEARDSRAASTLCKRDGIRYAGTTSNGAPVCITLSRDGDTLIETAFSFVPASGCPNRGVGNVHSDFVGGVNASGFVHNPDGLTATIRDQKASGVFEDPSICRGKRFHWSARRQP